MTKIQVLAQQTSNWLVLFDPGLLRLRSAIRTVGTMFVSLALLATLTHIVGQSVTVAMLGMNVSSMMTGISTIAGRRQQWMTALLLLLLPIGAATLGTLLVPYHLLGILGFIAIVFIAVYLRRFGQRGTMLGMSAYMTYFLLITFGTLRPSSITFAQLPWLILAIVIGVLCGFVINIYVLPDRPARILQNMFWALNLRICALIDVLRIGLENDPGDANLLHRIQHQLVLLNETVSMIQQQFERLESDTLFADLDKDELARRLFDTELAAESLIEPTMAVVSGSIPRVLRMALVETLGTLSKALCADEAITLLQQVKDAAVALATNPLADHREGRWLALACKSLAETALRLRMLTHKRGPHQSCALSDEGAREERVGQQRDHRAASGTSDDGMQNQPRSLRNKLLPTTRQALQVTLAVSLATLAGTLLSSHRWYWAVLTTFLIFTGTASYGELLVKAWQRVVGTLGGVVIGVVLASLVGGNVVVSVLLIFVTLFIFYWSQANNGVMMLSITTVLALLYELLGEFSIGLLLTRLLETAIGAAMGILVALFVLPTPTSETVREGMRAYLARLDDLVNASIGRLTDEPGEADLVAQSETLQQRLQQLREKAKPLVQGVAGIGAHRTMQRMMIGLLACTYYMRELTRLVEHIHRSSIHEPLRTTLKHVGAQISTTIETFNTTLGTRQPPSVQTAEERLASAEDTIRQQYREEEQQRLLSVVRALRAIDQVMVSLADDDLPSAEDRGERWGCGQSNAAVGGINRKRGSWTR